MWCDWYGSGRGGCYEWIKEECLKNVFRDEDDVVGYEFEFLFFWFFVEVGGYVDGEGCFFVFYYFYDFDWICVGDVCEIVGLCNCIDDIELIVFDCEVDLVGIVDLV